VETFRTREEARAALGRAQAHAAASCALAGPEATQWWAGIDAVAREHLVRAMERGVHSDRLKREVLCAVREVADRLTAEVESDGLTRLEELDDE